MLGSAEVPSLNSSHVKLLQVSAEVLCPVNGFYLNSHFCASSSQFHVHSKKSIGGGRGEGSRIWFGRVLGRGH